MVVLGHDTDALTAAQAARNAGAGIAEQGDGTMAAWRYAANGMAAQVVAEQAAGAWGDAGDTCRRIMVGWVVFCGLCGGCECCVGAVGSLGLCCGSCGYQVLQSMMQASQQIRP